MIKKKDYIRLIQTEPLLATNNSIKHAKEGLFTNSSNSNNLYFGTGLSTTKKVSQGFPIDFISMVVAAEILRQNLGFNKIIHEISDIHSISNRFIGLSNKKKIMSLAMKQKTLVEAMISSLGLSNNYEILFASDYQDTKEYKVIFSDLFEVSREDPMYARLQWAGMRYLNKHRDVKLKLGWLIDDDENLQGFDERYFDRKFDQICKEELSYAYTHCGRLFYDKHNRTRVSPYTYTEGERRIKISEEIDAISFLLHEYENKTEYFDPIFEYKKNIISSFERLFFKLSEEDFIIFEYPSLTLDAKLFKGTIFENERETFLQHCREIIKNNRLIKTLRNLHNELTDVNFNDMITIDMERVNRIMLAVSELSEIYKDLSNAVAAIEKLIILKEQSSAEETNTQRENVIIMGQKINTLLKDVFKVGCINNTY